MNIRIEDYLTQDEIKTILERAVYESASKSIDKLIYLCEADQSDVNQKNETPVISRDKRKKSQHYTYSYLKSTVGDKCCSCGSSDNIEYHHVVPLSLGGQDVITNIYPVCSSCHSLIHFGHAGNIAHAEATRMGMLAACERGVKLGRKPGTKVVTKKSIRAKKIIINESMDFLGNKTDSEVLAIIGDISRNSYYKYKKELKEVAEINTLQSA